MSTFSRAQEQFGLSDHAAFQRFVKAGAEFAFGQRAEHRGIDQNHAWVVKCADQIFSRAQIDGGLAADGGVHLREDRGGNLYQVEAAHVERGHQATDVAHYAASECDDD